MKHPAEARRAGSRQFMLPSGTTAELVARLRADGARQRLEGRRGTESIVPRRRR